ncbi:hypothetical protein ACH4OQ_38480 [Streptomyces luteogriseus]|uniref:hypothetical protein n=1 Tax=Streptomyces luteogriseus TaxID=68233 RepID=UPI0037B244F9
MHHQDHDQEQVLAAVLAALLLVGVTLIARELFGLWPAVVVGMGPVVAVYCGPPTARRIAVAVEVRRFRRRIDSHGRTAG